MMSRLFFIILVLVLFQFSCNKEETPPLEVPDFLHPQIEELENSGECYGCTITKISFNNSFYYHLYCGYWSCMYCNLYDNNGNLVQWEQEEFSDFLENKTVEQVIWKCGD